MVTLFTSLLITPQKGWETAKSITQSKRDVILKYALPLICVAGLSAIAGVFIETGNFDWALGLKQFVIVVVSLFTSIYLATYCIRITYKMMYKTDWAFSNAFIFTIYSFSCVFAVVILDKLLEDIFFIDIFYLYTVYIVYEGYVNYISIPDTKQDHKTALIIIASAFIIFWPPVVRKLLLWAMPGLN